MLLLQQFNQKNALPSLDDFSNIRNCNFNCPPTPKQVKEPMNKNKEEPAFNIQKSRLISKFLTANSNNSLTFDNNNNQEPTIKDQNNNKDKNSNDKEIDKEHIFQSQEIKLKPENQNSGKIVKPSLNDEKTDFMIKSEDPSHKFITDGTDGYVILNEQIKYDISSSEYLTNLKNLKNVNVNIKDEPQNTLFPKLNFQNKNGLLPSDKCPKDKLKEIAKEKENENEKESKEQLWNKNLIAETNMAEIVKIYHSELSTVYNNGISRKFTKFKKFKKIAFTKKKLDFPELQAKEKIKTSNGKLKPNPNPKPELKPKAKAKSSKEQSERVKSFAGMNPELILDDSRKNTTIEKVLIGSNSNSQKDLEFFNNNNNKDKNIPNIIDNLIYQRESLTGKQKRLKNNPSIEKSTKLCTNNIRDSIHTIRKEGFTNDKKENKVEKPKFNYNPDSYIHSPNANLGMTKQCFTNINNYGSSPKKGTLKGIINSGNNSLLVKRIFLSKYKDWLLENSSSSTNYSFKWEMWSKNIDFYSLGSHQTQCVNHFESNHVLTTKDNLFLNLCDYCESNHQNVFEYVPLTFSFDASSKEYSRAIEEFFKIHRLIGDIIASDNKNILTTVNRQLNVIGSTKSRPYMKLKLSDSQLDNSNTWILKPTGYNRGRGVSVFDNIMTLKKLINTLCGTSWEENLYKPYADKNLLKLLLKKKDYSEVKSKKFIIQKYIEKPLLLKGRKFDIRMWVLIDQEMNVYLYKEGYLRTSSKKFSLDHNFIPDKSVHLTNNAVQKNMKEYGEFEEGNQISLNSFQKYLDEINSGISVRKNLFQQMKQLVAISAKSIRGKINPNERNHQFEIFGYDFILDANYKMWLIEVNTTPCLEESSVILKRLLPRMIYDSFCITIDKIFNCNSNGRSNCPLIEGYDTNENLWEWTCEINIKWNGKIRKMVANHSFNYSVEKINLNNHVIFSKK